MYVYTVPPVLTLTIDLVTLPVLSNSTSCWAGFLSYLLVYYYTLLPVGLVSCLTCWCTTTLCFLLGWFPVLLAGVLLHFASCWAGFLSYLLVYYYTLLPVGLVSCRTYCSCTYLLVYQYPLHPGCPIIHSSLYYICIYSPHMYVCTCLPMCRCEHQSGPTPPAL